MHEAAPATTATRAALADGGELLVSVGGMLGQLAGFMNGIYASRPPGPAPEAGTVAETGDDVRPEQQAPADLLSRPDVDTALTELERMLDELQAGLTSELGLGGWQRTGDGGASGCGEFPGVGGQKRTTLTWMRPGGIPDELWPRTVQVLGEVSERYGFGPQQSVVDLPGRHDVGAFGPFGAYYNLATGANAAMYATTGCHPTAAAKSTGTSAPAG